MRKWKGGGNDKREREREKKGGKNEEKIINKEL